MLLVPLEDIVVFPNMNVTLTVDVGRRGARAARPAHEGEYANVGTVAEVTDRVRLPGGGRAVALTGLHRGIAGAAETDAQGRAARRGRGATRRDDRRRSRTRELETRVPRDRRGDPRAARRRRPHLARSSARSPTPAPSPTRSGYSPDFTFEQKVELLETLDVVERLELAIELQRERLAEMQVRRAHPRRRGGGRRRSSSASTSSASRWSRSARSSARTTRRSSTSTGARSRRPSCPSRPRAGRARARPARADGRQLGRVVDDPHLPRLAARRAVGRSAPRSASTRPTRARCSTPTTRASTT